jgi:hypothetical protein
MAVPKAAMNENHFPAAYEANIWSTWKIIAMKAIAISHFSEEIANAPLGPGVSGSNTGHCLRAT